MCEIPVTDETPLKASTDTTGFKVECSSCGIANNVVSCFSRSTLSLVLKGRYHGPVYEIKPNVSCFVKPASSV